MCGLSADELLLQKKHADILQSWHERHAGERPLHQPTPQRHTILTCSALLVLYGCVCSFIFCGLLAEFVELVRLLNPYLIVDVHALGDKFGPSTVIESLSAVVVSAETRDGAEKINAERNRKGLPPLDLVVVNLLDSHNYSAATTAVATVPPVSAAVSVNVTSVATPSSSSSSTSSSSSDAPQTALASIGVAASAKSDVVVAALANKVSSTALRMFMLSQREARLKRLLAEWMGLARRGGASEATATTGSDTV